MYITPRFLYFNHTHPFSCTIDMISSSPTFICLKMTLFPWFHISHTTATQTSFQILFCLKFNPYKLNCKKWFQMLLCLTKLTPTHLSHFPKQFVLPYRLKTNDLLSLDVSDIVGISYHLRLFLFSLNFP